MSKSEVLTREIADWRLLDNQELPEEHRTPYTVKIESQALGVTVDVGREGWEQPPAVHLEIDEGIPTFRFYAPDNDEVIVKVQLTPEGFLVTQGDGSQRPLDRYDPEYRQDRFLFKPREL